MSIRRARLSFDDKYAQIPNAWMRDKRLSRKARGLLAELLTHSVGWEITIESLVNSGPEGRDAIRSTIRELEQNGYLRRTRRRREDGTLSGSDYELTEPAAGEPTSANPTQADRPLKKTISQKTISQEHQRHLKPTRTASGRAMSSRQLTMLKDLVLLLRLDEGFDPEEHVRALVSTYDQADELIKEYWQQIEHEGREDISHGARNDPEMYAHLSPEARRFVDQEDIVSWMEQHEGEAA